MDENANTNDMSQNENLEVSENMVVCPDCGTKLILEVEAEIGDVIVCDNTECGVELEVVDINPIEVEYLMVQK
ncbi:hypothetical protein KC571_02820 [candidate division WWE3 bacterium]|uniref:Lysine biosynthesis protein LysW n=1 Tax=candidate division WWE3 bacterium TaxID=2053526 RepID=A0A955LH51_UNCKA|nr:hypothetical protein [candidate division WWE3 bacterium]